MDDLFGDVAPAGSSKQASALPQEQEEYESVLFVARECYVYRLPPRTSTAGYRAADWVLYTNNHLTLQSCTDAKSLLSREIWKLSSGKVRWCQCLDARTSAKVLIPYRLTRSMSCDGIYER